MLQITPQMRILVAVEAVDFRKYTPSINMRSWPVPTRTKGHLRSPGTAQNGATVSPGAWPATLSGGRKRPQRTFFTSHDQSGLLPMAGEANLGRRAGVKEVQCVSFQAPEMAPCSHKYPTKR
jgi:hypothetical protein